jgi:integrase
MDKFYSLIEAETLTKHPRAKLRKWLQAGKLAGREVLKGQRPVWEISQSAVDQLLGKKQHQSYQELLAQWQTEQASGYHTGAPIGQRGIETNLYGLEKYWQYLGQEPSLEGISAEGFRRAVTNVPIEYAKKNCHFTQRDQMFKGLCSLYKLLIRNGIKTKMELEELKQWKPKRIFPAKRKVLTEEQVRLLLEKNETWMTSRTEFDRELTRILIIFLTQTGLRKSEAMDLLVDDVDLNAGRLVVQDGKGHKTRVVGVTPFLKDNLQIWLSKYRPRSLQPHFFVQENGQPTTTNVIYRRIKRVADAAGLDINVHGLRRTFATTLAGHGTPLPFVQNQMGHSSAKTTADYILTDTERAVDWMRNFGAKPPEQAVQPQPTKSVISALSYFQMLNDGF